MYSRGHPFACRSVDARRPGPYSDSLLEKMMADFSLHGDAPLARRVKQSAQVVSSRLGDAGVLVHLQTNRIFEVNATGVRIWELAGEGRTIGEIEGTLRGE